MGKSLGQLVVSLRAGRTQAWLAREIGITPPAMCALENGNARFSDARLAGVLNALEASPLDRAQAWRMLFEEQGHSAADAERMARAKVLEGEVAA